MATTQNAGWIACRPNPNQHPPGLADLISAAAATAVGRHTRAEKDSDESETAYNEASAEKLGSCLMEQAPCAHLNHYPKVLF
jgi:hypothetical protein